MRMRIVFYFLNACLTRVCLRSQGFSKKRNTIGKPRTGDWVRCGWIVCVSVDVRDENRFRATTMAPESSANLFAYI
jgi:hypothetical protein